MTLADDPSTWPDTVATLGYIAFMALFIWLILSD